MSLSTLLNLHLELWRDFTPTFPFWEAVDGVPFNYDKVLENVAKIQAQIASTQDQHNLLSWMDQTRTCTLHARYFRSGYAPFLHLLLFSALIFPQGPHRYGARHPWPWWPNWSPYWRLASIFYFKLLLSTRVHLPGTDNSDDASLVEESDETATTQEKG